MYGPVFFIDRIGESPKEKLTFTSGRQMPVVCYQIAHAAIGVSFLGCVRRLCHTQLSVSWHLRNPWEMKSRKSANTHHQEIKPTLHHPVYITI